MTVKTATIEIKTHGNPDILDITDAVAATIQQTNLQNGIVTVFCPSSTSAVTTIEMESGCLDDLRRLFEDIVPANENYSHNARWGDGNGFSHVRSALLKPSMTIPFVEKRLTLGTWQQIVFMDFDNRPRHRELVIQIIGE